MDIDRLLFVDIETRSPVDLRATGVYVYAAHPQTDVTVARLAIGREAPAEWRPGRPLPDKYLAALADPTVEVVAHNAAFERIMLENVLAPRHGWPLVPIERWVCTMARARMQALPGSLDGAAHAAGLGVTKDQVGYALMLRMCRPRAVLPNGDIVWWTDEERMSRLSEYCSTDVKVERALLLSTAPLPEHERAVWDMTERMNDRGVCFDLSFVRAARVVAEDTRELLDREISVLTARRVERASNVAGIKQWLHRRGVDLSPPMDLVVRGPVAAVLDGELLHEAGEAEDVEDWYEVETDDRRLPDMRRRDVIRLIADDRVGVLEREVLKVRLEAGKISTRKLDAIVHRADEDGVVRGLLGYHGANTGRYVSTGLQIQNFPRDTVKDWDTMRDLLDLGADAVDCIGGPPLDVISRMLRGAIVARPGHVIMSGDFTSVEAVGVAWLSGQTELLESFRLKQKVYEQMAGRVYGRNWRDIEPDSKERQVGKTLVLGAGYQMGWYKFRETVLVMAGVLLTPIEAQHAINVYRDTFHRIPALWNDLNNAAMAAVRAPGHTSAAAGGRIRFRCERHWLRMRLPSGRYLWYRLPLIEDGKFGNKTITYMAVNAKTRRWERTHTYGGRLTENAVQGLCRDLLVDATLRLEEAGYRPITLVHDEVVAEPPAGYGSVEEMCDIMSELPDWAEGFALSAKGRCGNRYEK